MRFVEMDRNRDGIITRNEWNGSAQSFDMHDWNGDGRLSATKCASARHHRLAAAAMPINSATGRSSASGSSTPTATAGFHAASGVQRRRLLPARSQSGQHVVAQ
jgi:hypothetical protein